jgi:hypothetical protein
LSLLRWACIASLACGAVATAEAPRPIVALAFIGAESDRAAFAGSLSELLMRINIDMGARETDGPLPKDRLLAIVTADWSAPSDVTINILDAQEKVVLVRRLTRASSPSVLIEASTHIIQSVIEELAHPTVPLSPPPAIAAERAPLVSVEKPVPVPTSVPRTSGVAFEIGGHIGARGYGGDGPPVSPGGGLELAVTLVGGRWRPSAWLMGEYQAPFEIHHPLMDLSIQAVPIRAGIGVTAINGGTFRLDLAVGSGVDLFVTTPRTRLPEARLAQQRPFGSPIVTGRIALHLAVARSADVWLAFSLDADLTPRRWVFAAGPNNEPQPVYVPWQFRPALQLGFSFAALGPEPYSGRVGSAP